MRSFFNGTHRRPTWRKAGQDEGFRIVAVGPGDVRRLNRHWGEVKIPKSGWVRFRWSREAMTRSAKGTKEQPGRNVAQKTGLNREIRNAGWGMLVLRLEQKAAGRVEKVPAAAPPQLALLSA
jgi:hypothetical protein